MKTDITSGKTNKCTKEENTMIIMDLKIDNFFAFKDFHMNMSYPKKIVNSYIPNEHLSERNNFRYKKVNILMGGNATGKTSIGMLLLALCVFVKKKDSHRLIDRIADKNRTATLSVDFVGKMFKMYRLNIKITPPEEGETEPHIWVCKREASINEADRYETCVQRIEELPLEYKEDCKAEMEGIEPIGWMFTYPSDASDEKKFLPNDSAFVKVLDYTLRALDPAIISVDKSNEVDNTYIIHLNSGDLLVQNGEVIRKNILSSGTKAGIDIASLIFSIYQGECGFYYCDEKFSYIHSELEKAFLATMIHGLKDNEQIFFTTHNSDILDMPLPKHSFTFLRKDVYDSEQIIKCVYASDYLKRSTDSLHKAVDNDLFSIAPNVEFVYKIAEIEEFAQEENE